MTIDEWIAGKDSVDAELNIKKIELIKRAKEFCIAAPLQWAFAHKNNKKSHINDIASGKLEVTPFENSFVSDPTSMDLVEKIRSSAGNEAFVIRALQDMTTLAFECEDGKFTKYSAGVVNFATVGLYLSALYELFAGVLPGKQFKNVDGLKMQRIDFALCQLLYAAGQIGAAYTERAVAADGRVQGIGTTIEESRRKQKVAKDLYYGKYDGKLNGKTAKGTSDSSVAKTVKNRWDEMIENGIDKVRYGANSPSEKQIKRYLENEGIIKPT